MPVHIRKKNLTKAAAGFAMVIVLFGIVVAWVYSPYDSVTSYYNREENARLAAHSNVIGSMKQAREISQAYFSSDDYRKLMRLLRKYDPSKGQGNVNVPLNVSADVFFSSADVGLQNYFGRAIREPKIIPDNQLEDIITIQKLLLKAGFPNSNQSCTYVSLLLCRCVMHNLDYMTSKGDLNKLKSYLYAIDPEPDLVPLLRHMYLQSKMKLEYIQSPNNPDVVQKMKCRLPMIAEGALSKLNYIYGSAIGELMQTDSEHDSVQFLRNFDKRVHAMKIFPDTKTYWGLPNASDSLWITYAEQLETKRKFCETVDEAVVAKLKAGG